MAESTVRLLHPGVMTKTPGYRTALALFLLMLVPIFQPVDADLSASKDDFGHFRSVRAFVSQNCNALCPAGLCHIRVGHIGQFAVK